MKEWGWIEENPMHKVTKLREAPGRERFLSLEEKNRLFEACRQSRNPNLYPIVSLALITGMRFGEITGLRWGDVNFIQNTITIEKTKNGDRRIIPLTQAMKNIFQLCPTYGLSVREFVFQTPKKKQVTSVREAFNKALIRASIEDFTFHSLRHTAASFFAMNGSGLTEMAEILGHKTLQMVKRYSHFSQTYLHTVIERNEKMLIAEEESD